MQLRLDRQSVDGRSWYFRGIDDLGNAQEVQVYLLDSERYVVVIDKRCLPFHDWATLSEAREAAEDLLDRRANRNHRVHDMLSRLARPLDGLRHHHA